jgi:hypothetical protein
MEWDEIRQERLDFFPEYPPFSLEALRHDLRTKELDEITHLIGLNPHQYSFGLVESFILDKSEYPHLRRIALEAYLRSVPPEQRSQKVAKTLLRDFDADVREFAIKKTREYRLDISEDDLRRLLNDTSQDVVVHSVKLAADLLQQGKISANLFIVPSVIRHPYWLIRKLAIEAIVKADPNFDKPDTISLLQELRLVKYHVSRRRIIEYIQQRFEAGQLSGEDYQIAISIIQKYATDDLSTQEITESAIKLLGILTDRQSEDQDQSLEIST